MQEVWTHIATWFLGLGDRYGVDPIIFGTIYVGAIPFFFLSVAWIVKAKRNNQSTTLPILSLGFWTISPYLYLFIEGENIPWWVYASIVLLLAYGGYTSYHNIRAKLKQE